MLMPITGPTIRLVVVRVRQGRRRKPSAPSCSAPSTAIQGAAGRTTKRRPGAVTAGRLPLAEFGLDAACDGTAVLLP